MRTLDPLPLSPADPVAAMGDLALALEGTKTFLPVPAHDHARAQLLRTTQHAGEEIDAGVALVMATSGSTGTPKGALLTPDNLLSSAAATHTTLEGPGQWLLALPPAHIAGIQVLIRSLVAGTTPVCLNVTERGFDCAAFAEATRSMVTSRPFYCSLVPLQLHKLLSSLEGIDAARQFTAILVGGGPIGHDLMQSAKALRINVITTYGSSETSGGCVYNGKALPGVTVDTATGDDFSHAQGQTLINSCAETATGSRRILLTGPMVASGYRNPNQGGDAFTFRPGWFATSDGGHIDDDGTLHVQGRLDAVIDTGGLKLHPEILEAEIKKTDGVEDVCVTAIPDERLGQAVVCAWEGTATQFDIIEELEDLPRWMLPKQFKRVDRLPRTGPGKPDRRAVAKLFHHLLPSTGYVVHT